MMFMPMSILAVALAAGPVSLQYEGPLKDALKQIAQKGGLNVIVAGKLDEHVEVNLSDVTAEEALQTVAKVYKLDVTHEGKLWVVREAKGEAAPVAPVAPVPPVPPVPVLKVQVGDEGAEASPADTIREAADRAREEADRAREHAEALREQAQEIADAKREEAEALREQAQAHREMAQAQAEFEKHRVSAGGPVRVEKGTHVDTAVAYGGPVIVEEDAVVEGDAVAFGGDVVLNEGAVVEGDAVSFGGNVVRGANSQVHGESVSMGGTGIGSAMARSAIKTKRVSEDHGSEAGSSSGFGNRVATFLLQFAVFFGLGFVLMMFAPQRMKAVEAAIRAEPGKNGLVGFLGFLALAPATLLLIVTIIGIPVALVMWLTLPFFAAAGLVAVANLVGVALPTGRRLRKTQALALALGLLAMMVIGYVPVVGPLVLSLAGLVSMGAIIRTRFGQPPRGLPTIDPVPHAATV